MDDFMDRFNKKFNTNYNAAIVNSVYVYVKEYDDKVELYGVLIEDKELNVYFYIWGIYSCSEPPNYDAEDYVSNNLELVKNKLKDKYGYDYVIDISEINDNEEFNRVVEMIQYVLDECNYHNMLDKCEI